MSDGPYRNAANVRSAQQDWRAAADTLRSVKGLDWLSGERDGLASMLCGAADCVDRNIFTVKQAAAHLKTRWLAGVGVYRQRDAAEAACDVDLIVKWRRICESYSVAWAAIERWYEPKKEHE